MNPTEQQIDAVAAILEREGLTYVNARRTAKEILALPQPVAPPRPITRHLTLAEVEGEQSSA